MSASIEDLPVMSDEINMQVDVNLRSFPPIGGKQKMNYVILLLALAAQVVVNHLANWRAPVCKAVMSVSYLG